METPSLPAISKFRRLTQAIREMSIPAPLASTLKTPAAKSYLPDTETAPPASLSRAEDTFSTRLASAP
jgi:hypothetical protein